MEDKFVAMTLPFFAAVQQQSYEALQQMDAKVQPSSPDLTLLCEKTLDDTGQSPEAMPLAGLSSADRVMLPCSCYICQKLGRHFSFQFRLSARLAVRSNVTYLDSDKSQVWLQVDAVLTAPAFSEQHLEGGSSGGWLQHDDQVCMTRIQCFLLPACS